MVVVSGVRLMVVACGVRLTVVSSGVRLTDVLSGVRLAVVVTGVRLVGCGMSLITTGYVRARQMGRCSEVDTVFPG